MAYPESTQILLNGLQQTQGQASNVKSHSQRLRDSILAGPVERGVLITHIQMQSRAIAIWNETKLLGTPADPLGMQEYARQQYNDSSLDFVRELNIMIDRSQDVVDWINGFFPRDTGASEAWFRSDYNTDGSAKTLTFTSAELDPLRALLDALLLSYV